jgi:AraC family transcriptional activator of pobA
MGRELGWSGAGQRAAVEATWLSLMVLALRHAAPAEAPQRGTARQAALVARLRERIEQRFRARESVVACARALGASPTALRQACARVANSSPTQMLDDRALLEARRLLLYSQLSVAEIAYAVGFDDPAYFSRFFTRHVGQPPSAYRSARGKPPA